MELLNYKGYIAKIDIDVEEGILSGRVMNIRDIIHFEAETLAQLEKEFKFSVDDYIAFCKENGVEPEKPCSGKISLRVSPELHRAAITAASREGKSLNAWIGETVERAALR